MSKKYKKGSGLVEILVAIFIFTLILGSLINASNMYLSSAIDSLESTKASYLAEEGIEAIKTIRDNNWNNISSLSNDTDYYLYFDTSSSTKNIWVSTTTSYFVDSIYDRRFRLGSVYRDANGRIVSSGGSLDPDTKIVTVSIIFTSRNSTTTKTLSTYITNIF